MTKKETIITEAHFNFLEDIEAKAMEIQLISDGLKILSEEFDNHFAPREEGNTQAWGLVSLITSGARSIKTLSEDIHATSDALQKGLKFRMKEQEAGKE